MRIASRLSVPMLCVPVVNVIRAWSPSIATSCTVPTSMPTMRTLSPLLEPAGVAELRVVVGRREQHRQAAEALSHTDNEDHDRDGQHPDTDPVGGLQRSHCSVHLPDGCCEESDRANGSARLKSVDLERQVAEVEVEEVAVDAAGAADDVERGRAPFRRRSPILSRCSTSGPARVSSRSTVLVHQSPVVGQQVGHRPRRVADVRGRRRRADRPGPSAG